MPWAQQNNFRYKTMAYQQSCFPCSLHMVLRNLGRYRETNEIEDNWNQLQTGDNRPNLNEAAPNEDDIHRNVAQTPLQGAGSRIITPAMLGPDLDQQAFNQEAQNFFNDFAGMIIGVGHATVVYKKADNRYVYVRPAPDIDNTQIEEDNQVQLDVIQGVDGSFALRIRGVNNVNFEVVGNFIMLLR